MTARPRDAVRARRRDRVARRAPQTSSEAIRGVDAQRARPDEDRPGGDSRERGRDCESLQRDERRARVRAAR